MKTAAIILAMLALTGCSNLKLQCVGSYQTDNVARVQK